MTTPLRNTLLVIALIFAVTTISGCAATHYGGGLDATYGGDGIRILAETAIAVCRLKRSDNAQDNQGNEKESQE